MEQIKIMIIDDDEMSLMGLENALSLNNFDVKTYQNSDKAIQAFDPAEFDVVITDIRMKGMSGYEVFKAVREKSPEIPVIFISGYLDIEKRMEESGYSEVPLFKKPINIARLINMLKRFNKNSLGGSHDGIK